MKIKVKIGMVKLNNISLNSSCIKKVLILEEYNNQCLVLWGKDVLSVGGFDINPNGDLIDTERIFNIKEKEISKFRLWMYKCWNNF